MLSLTEPIQSHVESPPASGVAPSVAIVCRLTAITLLLRPFEVWWIAPFVLAGAGLSLIFPAVSRRPVTWWILSALIALRIVAVWPLSDNHIYLLAYWCLGLGLALSSQNPSVVLAASARWLLGAAFVFAVLWKAVLSPDYLDGRFFRVTLMSDDRFADAVMLVGGLTADEIRQNRSFLTPLPEGAELADPPPFKEPPRFRALAGALTWGGLMLEVFLAVAFLSPVRGRLELVRHAALIAFCVVTYAFAPVAGFGWLIATMGLAQCRPEQRTLRGIYVAAFFLVLLYSEIPWAGVLANWVGPAAS